MANRAQLEDADAHYGTHVDESFDLRDRQALSQAFGMSDYGRFEYNTSAVRPRRERVFSQGSPINPNNMNLDSLTLEDHDPHFPPVGSSHYGSPLRHSHKSSYDSSLYGASPSTSFRRSSSIHSNFSHGGRFGIGSHRRTNTWMSPEAQTQQEYLTVRNCMRRVFKHSEVSKWKLDDYIAHREAMLASEANRLARRLKDKEKEKRSESHSLAITSDFQYDLRDWGFNGNFDQEGNFGRVLGEPTIWCRDWKNGKDDIAPWPTVAEMKWEGDDRAKTGVGRFLPLPREQGPHNIQWNQLSVIEQYPMDQVAKIPTMEDVYLPVDPQIEPEREYLWSKRLEEEMDALSDL